MLKKKKKITTPVQAVDMAKLRLLGEPKESIKDKVIMVFYVENGNMISKDVNAYIHKVIAQIGNKERFNDIVEYFIPARKRGIRLEVIVPGKDIQNEETVLEKLQNIENMYKQILEKYETTQD